MPENEVDLAKLFNTVTEALQGEKDSLNSADSVNHDHGDHMVENFKVISAALEQKRGSTPSEQLAFASEKLSQSATTGSAKVYSEGLTRAASQLQGQSTVTTDNALSLVQSLLGGASAGPSALPGTRGITRRGTSLGNLLTAGSAYMQAKQEGQSPLGALLKAVMAGSQMKQTAHQSQSGQVVGGTLINALTSLLGGQKPKSKPRPKPAAKPKEESKRKAKPKAEPKAKPKPKPKAKPKVKPKAKPAAKAKAKPKRKTES